MSDQQKTEKGTIRIKVVWIGLASAFVAVAIFAGIVGYSLPPSHIITTVTDSITTTTTLRLYTSINGNYTLSVQNPPTASSGLLLDTNFLAVILTAGFVGVVIIMVGSRR